MCCNPDTHLPVLLMELKDNSLARFLVDSPVPLPLYTKNCVNIFQLRGLYVCVCTCTCTQKINVLGKLSLLASMNCASIVISCC